MDTLPPEEPSASFTLEIVHDLVCPWCYLGVRRLKTALARRPDLRCRLVWRPFLLNPDMPATGISRADYVLRKFGSEERGRRLHQSITEIGRNEGILFRFERIRRASNSLLAHRLVRHVSRRGDPDTLVLALFAAQFEDGLDLGDPVILAMIAMRLGEDPRAVRAFLDSDAELDTIHADNLRAHRLGINGVPCFLIGGRNAIAGAQDPDVIERMLDVAAMDSREGWARDENLRDDGYAEDGKGEYLP